MILAVDVALFAHFVRLARRWGRSARYVNNATHVARTHYYDSDYQ